MNYVAEVFGITVVSLSGVDRAAFDGVVAMLEAMVDRDADGVSDSQLVVSKLSKLLLLVVPDTEYVTTMSKEGETDYKYLKLLINEFEVMEIPINDRFLLPW